MFCCLLCLLVVSSLRRLAAGPCIGVGMAVVLQCLSQTAGCCGTSSAYSGHLLFLCLVNNKVSAFCGVKHEFYCPELSAHGLCSYLSRFVVLGERNRFLSFAGSMLHSDTLQSICKSCFPYELSSGLCNISMNFLMLCLNRREQRSPGEEM